MNNEFRLKEKILEMVETCLTIDLKNMFDGKEKYKPIKETITDYETYWFSMKKELSNTEGLTVFQIDSIIKETFLVVRKKYPKKPVLYSTAELKDLENNRLMIDLNRIFLGYLKKDEENFDTENIDLLKYFFEGMIEYYFFKTLHTKEKLASAYNLDSKLVEKGINQVFYELMENYTKISDSSYLNLKKVLFDIKKINRSY